MGVRLLQRRRLSFLATVFAKENETRLMTTCGEVMTANPTCCVHTDSTEHAAQLMRSEGLGPIPVIESKDSKKLVGIITDRDLVLKVLAEGRDASDTTVEIVMTSDPVTCREQDDVQKALDAMIRHQVRRIPVVSDDNKIIGIIAQADVATKVEQPDKTGEVVEEISKPDSENT